MILLILLVPPLANFRGCAWEAVGWKRRTTQDATPQAQGRSRKNNAMLMPRRGKEKRGSSTQITHSHSPFSSFHHYAIHMCGNIVVKANVAQITPFFLQTTRFVAALYPKIGEFAHFDPPLQRHLPVETIHSALSYANSTLIRLQFRVVSNFATRAQVPSIQFRL